MMNMKLLAVVTPPYIYQFPTPKNVPLCQELHCPNINYHPRSTPINGNQFPTRSLTKPENELPPQQHFQYTNTTRVTTFNIVLSIWITILLYLTCAPILTFLTLFPHPPSSLNTGFLMDYLYLMFGPGK